MHMLSRKGLNSVEIVRECRKLATVITAKGGVQTNEKSTPYVRDLKPFVSVQILEDTLAFLSFGKFCGEHGYS